MIKSYSRRLFCQIIVFSFPHSLPPPVNPVGEKEKVSKKRKERKSAKEISAQFGTFCALHTVCRTTSAASAASRQCEASSRARPASPASSKAPCAKILYVILDLAAAAASSRVFPSSAEQPHPAWRHVALPGVCSGLFRAHPCPPCSRRTSPTSWAAPRPSPACSVPAPARRLQHVPD